MAEYTYTVSINIDLKTLSGAITSSDMTDKSVQRIDKEGTDLKITFEASLDAGDKTILDGLVGSAIDVIKDKTRNTIMTEILMTSEQTTQLPRMLSALDKYPSFAVFLDNFNYPMARMRMQLALANGDITQADYDLIDVVIP